MASPQKEEGYTPIANELLEVIYRTNFTASEYKIILLIMRYTFGFNRVHHQFSLTFLSKGTGVSRRYVSNAMSKLIEDRVLLVVKEHTDSQSRVIKINKDYESWLNRTTIQQMIQNTTDEPQFNTTDEPQFNTTDEPQFNQDNKNLKQYINNIYTQPKPGKHKYGEYNKVLLSDNEKSKLLSELGQDIFDKCIKKLDEYIQETGKKYKDHNLTIRRWVIDAVKQESNKKPVETKEEEKGVDFYSADYYKQFTE